jgi:FkbM family methyltransferase
MTFVDAGSNKGDFALIAARVMNDEGRVLAFEPAPENARWVRASVELNGYRSITVFELALADSEGRVPLHLGEWSGWHSLVPGRRSKQSIEVEARTLDAVLAQTGDPHVDVLKIDVEGAELRLLGGATQTLADTRLFAILVDLHPALGIDANEVWEVLGAHGFGLRDPEDLDVELAKPPAGANELVLRRP